MLSLVLMAGMRPSRYDLKCTFLARQRWSYRDVIIVWVVFTAAWVVPLHSTLTDPRLFDMYYGVVGIILIVTIWAIVRTRQRSPWRALGLDTTTAVYDALWSLRIGLGFVSFGAGLMVIASLGQPVDGSRDGKEVVWQGQIVAYVAAVIVTTLIIPLAEELLFRGLSYAPLARKFGLRGATLGTAALWAAVHFDEVAYRSHLRVVSVFVVGIVFAEIYRRRQSLVPTLVFHSLKNTAAMFVDGNSLGPLLGVTGASVVLWIISASLFHFVARSQKHPTTEST